MKKLFIITILIFSSLGLHAQKAKKVKAKAKQAEAVSVAPISKDAAIFLSNETLDYGEIKKGSEGTREFEVMNKGAQPLLLTGCSGSCGCTVPTCPREPIMPGKSAKISVKYDTNRVGPINKIVTIMSNDPSNPSKTVAIRGTVIE